MAYNMKELITTFDFIVPSPKVKRNYILRRFNFLSEKLNKFNNYMQNYKPLIVSPSKLQVAFFNSYISYAFNLRNKFFSVFRENANSIITLKKTGEITSFPNEKLEQIADYEEFVASRDFLKQNVDFKTLIGYGSFFNGDLNSYDQDYVMVVDTIDKQSYQDAMKVAKLLKNPKFRKKNGLGREITFALIDKINYPLLSLFNEKITGKNSFHFYEPLDIYENSIKDKIDAIKMVGGIRRIRKALANDRDFSIIPLISSVTRSPFFVLKYFKDNYGNRGLNLSQNKITQKLNDSQIKESIINANLQLDEIVKVYLDVIPKISSF